MASRMLSWFAGRTLPRLRAGGAGVRGPRTAPRSDAAALTGGRAALLLGAPALSCLGYEACRWVRRSAVLHAVGTDEVLEEADDLYSCGETEKLYQLLLQHRDSDDAGLLWRLARASRDLTLLPGVEDTRKKQLAYEAFEYAKRALEKDDKCSATHKWYALCLSAVSEHMENKVKIANSCVIREHLERALELNARDATCLYTLGDWCFRFAKLLWYERKIAATLFSSPPVSTYEEALEFFLKAEEVDPDFSSKNQLMLGKTYMAMRDNQRAKFWFTKAKDYPAHTLEDEAVRREAADLLKKLG